MAKPTIYGTPGSRTYRVLWLAKELGIDYDHVPVNHHKHENEAPDYAKINPNAKIPALRDGDFVLWESLAMNIYLAHQHPGAVSPKSYEEEMLAVQWSMWGLTEVETPAADLMNELQKPEAKRSADVIAHLRDKLPKPLGVLNGVLADRDYLVGDRFTVADLNTAAAIRVIFRCGMDLKPYPNVEKWFESCVSRPAAKEAIGMQAQAMAAA